MTPERLTKIAFDADYYEYCSRATELLVRGTRELLAEREALVAEVERLQSMEQRIRTLSEDCSRGRKECQVDSVPTAFRQHVARIFKLFGRELQTALG